MADKEVIKSWCGIRRSYNNFFDFKFHTNKGKGFCVSSPQTSTLQLKHLLNDYLQLSTKNYLPSPETSRELRKRSSPALKVVTQSPTKFG